MSSDPFGTPRETKAANSGFLKYLCVSGHDCKWSESYAYGQRDPTLSHHDDGSALPMHEKRHKMWQVPGPSADSKALAEGIALHRGAGVHNIGRGLYERVA